MVFKIISVGSIPATLVIHRFQRKLPVKIYVNKLKYKRYCYSQRFLNVLKYKTNSRTCYNSPVNNFVNSGVLETSGIKLTKDFSYSFSHHFYFLYQLLCINSFARGSVIAPTNCSLLSVGQGSIGLTLYTQPFLNHHKFSYISGGGDTKEYFGNLCSPGYSGGLYTLTGQVLRNDILNSWFLINFVKLVYKYFSKKVLLGIYAVSSSYFLSNNIYFPSVDNIKVFTSDCFIKLSTGNAFTNSFSYDSKLFLKYYNKYSSHDYFTSSKQVKLSIRNYKIILKHSKQFKSNLSFLKECLKCSPIFNKVKVTNYFFRFFKRSRVQSCRLIIDRLSRSLATSSRVHDVCKTFKLLRARIKYFSEFECIYNPSVVGSAGTLTNKVFFLKNQTSFKLRSKIVPSTYSTQSVFKSVKSNLLRKHIIHSNIYFMPFCFKLAYFFDNHTHLVNKMSILGSNIIPNYVYFNHKLNKHIHSARLNYSFRGNVTPWVYNTMVRFMEHFSGKKVCLDIYSFMSQAIDESYVALYKSWLPRFSYYERRLGHRFFLEESLQILHMGFNYQDSKLISSWLKSLIQRISFWKTRFIFRFIRYLFNNYFQYMFDEIGVKGFKVRLKGKISVAGNSRKRSILYRVGKTSHTSVGLKVAHTMDTITTFTGVMGFQVWIFY